MVTLPNVLKQMNFYTLDLYTPAIFRIELMKGYPFCKDKALLDVPQICLNFLHLGKLSDKRGKMGHSMTEKSTKFRVIVRFCCVAYSFRGSPYR